MCVYVREGIARKGYKTPLASLMPPALASVVPKTVRLKHLLSHSMGLPAVSARLYSLGVVVGVYVLCVCCIIYMCVRVYVSMNALISK